MGKVKSEQSMEAGSLDPAGRRTRRDGGRVFRPAATGRTRPKWTAASEGADLQRFVRLAKQRSGFVFTRTHARRLWQESYFDRSLRENETTTEVISYIVGNPVRAGLVQAPEEYPFWGSQTHSREEILDFISIEAVSRV